MALYLKYLQKFMCLYKKETKSNLLYKSDVLYIIELFKKILSSLFSGQYLSIYLSMLAE